MDVINYTEFRKNLASYIDKVNEDQTPIVVTRQKGEPVVMISLKDFNAYEETSYLTNSPANAKRLRKSLENARMGNVSQNELLKE